MENFKIESVGRDKNGNKTMTVTLDGKKRRLQVQKEAESILRGLKTIDLDTLTLFQIYQIEKEIRRYYDVPRPDRIFVCVEGESSQLGAIGFFNLRNRERKNAKSSGYYCWEEFSSMDKVLEYFHLRSLDNRFTDVGLNLYEAGKDYMAYDNVLAQTITEDVLLSDLAMYGINRKEI